MFKGNRKYIFFLVVCFSALILLQFLAPKPINWKLSYSGKDKIPYGTSALYNALEQLFPYQTIESKKLPLYNTLNKNNFSNTNYVIINESFNPDSLDTRELLRFVEQGNCAFIAANFFSGKFADKLKIKTDNIWNIASDFAKDSTAFNKLYTNQDSFALFFYNKKINNQKPFVYPKTIENTNFTKVDTSKTIALGFNQDKKMNLIKMKYGRGTFYLSSTPEAFTNFHFVSKNHDYVYSALSYLPEQTVFWDEYYKIGNVKTDNPLRVVFTNEALASAYYLLICSLLIFMIIGIKRKQRAIPVIEPLQNTTLQFVDVVGTLYYQTGNNKNITEKKINYFLEYIRTNFQVKTTLYDDAFISRITSLSGIDMEKVRALFFYFSDLSLKSEITHTELLKLNSMIENFYKESKR